MYILYRICSIEANKNICGTLCNLLYIFSHSLLQIERYVHMSHSEKSNKNLDLYSGKIKKIFRNIEVNFPFCCPFILVWQCVIYSEYLARLHNLKPIL